MTRKGATQPHAVKIHFDAQLLDRSLSSAKDGRIRETDDRIACTCKQDFGGKLPPETLRSTVYFGDDRS